MRYLIIAAILLVGTVFAMAVTEADVVRIAETQLMGHSGNAELSIGARSVKKIVPLIENGETIAFVVELNPTGFIAIAPDDGIRPVIAYSYGCDFDYTIGAPGRDMLVWDMKSRLAAIPYTSQETIDENNELWRLYIESDPELMYRLSTTTVTGPLLDTRWDQGSPFNNLCPIDPETSDRSVVGCTATSMAQIINYWEYPSSVHFSAGESYESDSTTPSIWIDATTATIDSIDYNGAGMHPDATMKAAISWACGVSIYAIYSSEGTIAWFHDSSFTDKWGYVRAEKVDPPDMPEFYDTLVANMLTARPVQLGIFYYDPPDTSGHAIVCDGWMDTGEYHLNYGWSGYSDGWYFLPTGIPAPFDIVRWAIVNIEPPHRADSPDDCASAIALTITDETGLISDELFPGDEDWFSFYASPEYTYLLKTEGLTDSRGEILDSCGGAILMTDDNSGSNDNFFLVFFPGTSGNYFLRVSQSAETAPFIYNLHYERVSPPSVSITMPNGGETVNDNSTQVITWIREGMPDIPVVVIEYSMRGADGPWSMIADSIANSGLFIWNVPDMDTTSHDCYIRISEYGLRRVSDMSDARFTILDVSNVSEIPNIPKDIAILVYPNPFNSSVTITVGASFTPAWIEVFDMTGRIIAEIPANSYLKAQHTAPVSDRARSIPINFIWTPDENIESGLYLIRARFDNIDGYNNSSLVSRIIYLK